MTDLRALVGVGFLPAVMRFVVSVPLGWGLVLVAAEKFDLLDTNIATAEQLKALSYWRGLHREDHQGRPYRRKEELVQEKILPRAAYERIKYELVAKQK
jgi:hypothetical protein